MVIEEDQVDHNGVDTMKQNQIQSFIEMNLEGLSTRVVGNSDEIQLRIDPMHGELDDHITGLHKKITQLKSVAQEIESEAKYQNDFINQLNPNNWIPMFLKTANDIDQSSSRREEQREAVEQKYCPAGFKPRLACDTVCTLLFLHGLPVVQVFQKIAG
ncbi:hypothetical protein Syun_025096 [Stephania yunnanensis]|uniref:t-SNARE coiled-coil homology domain-containing protein n=1 Tax=Stephania yunnanensis TaxID=152371 RepID=A0AAP0ERH4_9MAGN